MGLYVTDREVLRLVLGFGVVRHVNLLILFWDGEVCFCTRCNCLTLVKTTPGRPDAEKKGRSGHDLLVVLCLSIRKICFFLNYIDLFWSPSRKEIIAYHSYISIIDEEELATLRRFTMSSTFWWSLSNIVGGLSARVYDILRPDRPKNDAPWPWPIEFDDLAQHEGANKRNLWKVFYTWHNKRITAQH